MTNIWALAVVAVLGLQCCIAKPADKSQLEVLADNAKTIAENVTHTLGLHDITSDKVVNTIKDQAQALSDNLNKIKARVEKEVASHQDEVKTQLVDLEQKLKQSLESLGKIVDPEKKAQKGAEEVRAQFDKSLKTAAEGFEQLVKSMQPGAQEAGDNIKKFSKSLLDSFVATGQDIQAKVTKAIEEHDKGH